MILCLHYEANQKQIRSIILVIIKPRNPRGVILWENLFKPAFGIKPLLQLLIIGQPHAVKCNYKKSGMSMFHRPQCKNSLTCMKLKASLTVLLSDLFTACVNTMLPPIYKSNQVLGLRTTFLCNRISEKTFMSHLE